MQSIKIEANFSTCKIKNLLAKIYEGRYECFYEDIVPAVEYFERKLTLVKLK